MPYNLFEYVSASGKAVFGAWRDDLDKIQRAKLHVKLTLLKTSGPDLSPGLLAGTSSGHIKKIKVQGNVKLRPRICLGPIFFDSEFSLLVGAFERDMKTIPADADEIAITRRLEIMANATHRRRLYVS